MRAGTPSPAPIHCQAAACPRMAGRPVGYFVDFGKVTVRRKAESCMNTTCILQREFKQTFGRPSSLKHT